MNLERLDSADEAEAAAALARCCGARAWVRAMLGARPFGSREALHAAASRAAGALGAADWREAFAQHPRIGDRAGVARHDPATAAWAGGEQAGAAAADEATARALVEGNLAYEARFGHVFIVRAAGRTAAEMLALLRERLGHEPEAELHVAAREQLEITHLRLDKLLEEGT